MSSRARSTRVQESTVLPLVCEIIVSAQIHSAEVSRNISKIKFYNQVLCLREKKIKIKKSACTHQNLQHGTTQKHTDLHSCHSDFIASASSASASWLEGRASGSKAHPHQILHTEKCQRHSSTITLCTPRE